MPKVCIYCQVHQPNRLRKYSYFDIGRGGNYEDEQLNRGILQKVATKCYLPTNKLLLKLIEQYRGDFKVSFSLSGTVIEQLRKFSPETLDSFKQLADTGCVEFINETYYHSLSFLFSPDEFREQVRLHNECIEREFGQKATTFRNTELIYNNALAKAVEDLGYKVILTEGADKILGWRSPNLVYHPMGCKDIKLLLKNYKLSDDIAFRFSDKSWQEHPLTADKYAHWLHAIPEDAHVINLFMDYETFGEHQWQETGIFEFLAALPDHLLQHSGFSFVTPAEIADEYEGVAELDVPHFISWADTERDLTAWCGNNLQEDALHSIYKLENKVKDINDEELTHAWRSLQTSDHFYYMCTKWFNDGDVHAYFNPYQSPYEAYINFQNIISDLNMELDNRRANHG